MNRSVEQFGEPQPTFLLRVIVKPDSGTWQILIKSTFKSKPRLFTSLEAAFMHIRAELNQDKLENKP
ncbi:MAG: hypothetical protein AAGD96_04840 [Chloroflexota bacterium]